MLALQRVLVGVGFAKGISRGRPSKRVLVDDGLANVSEFFNGR